MKGISFVAAELALVVLAVVVVRAVPKAIEDGFAYLPADEDLICAAWAGDEERLEVALQRGASISGRDAQGSTALHYAALSGNAALVARLIELGAEVNVENHARMTPLISAAMNDDVPVVRALLRGGAHASDRAIDAAVMANADDAARVLRKWRDRPPEVQP